MVGEVSKRERIIWFLGVVFMAAISVFAVIKYQTAFNLASQRIAELEDEKAPWVQQEAPPAEPTNPADPAACPDIAHNLKQQGFNGSVQDIIDDLVKHPELIPYDGVLGGKMGFYYKENIHVLTDKWVFAGFDDGHINGYMLLSYNIKNGAISWKALDSYLSGE